MSVQPVKRYVFKSFSWILFTWQKRKHMIKNYLSSDIIRWKLWYLTMGAKVSRPSSWQVLTASSSTVSSRLPFNQQKKFNDYCETGEIKSKFQDLKFSVARCSKTHWVNRVDISSKLNFFLSFWDLFLLWRFKTRF